MSLKLIEYLSMDLRVVGHITGEPRDVFGDYCFLCHPSAHALAEKIIEVSENHHQGKSARDFIVQRYDWRVIGHSLNDFLRNWVE